MAQKRMLYSNIWESGQIAKLSKPARLLYIGTITIADDDGRFKANPSLLRSKVFPLDEDVTVADVSTWLKEIIDVGLITTYEVAGEIFAFHPNWTKYQTLRADRKKDSLIPLPPDDNQVATNCQPDDGHQTAEDKVSKVSKDKVSKGRVEELFELFWSQYPNKTSKKKASEKWFNLFKALTGAEADKLSSEVTVGLERAKKSSQWQKDNGQYIPHPTTWLNQERWKDEGVRQTFSTGGSSDKFKNVGKKI
jgi:hypothetical protein